MLLSTEEKIKVVRWYWETQSIIATQRKFRSHFRTKHAPCAKSILRLQEKFLADGTVSNQRKGSSGRKRSKRTPEGISKVKDLISNTPSKSIRKLAKEAGTSHTTVRQILRKDLKFYPYRMNMHQMLSDGDKEQRMTFSSWLKEKTDADPELLESRHLQRRGTFPPKRGS